MSNYIEMKEKEEFFPVIFQPQIIVNPQHRRLPSLSVLTLYITFGIKNRISPTT